MARAPEQCVLLKTLPEKLYVPHFSTEFDQLRIMSLVRNNQLTIPATELEHMKILYDKYTSPSKKQKFNRGSAQDDFINPLLDDNEDICTDMKDDETAAYSHSSLSSNSRKRARP